MSSNTPGQSTTLKAGVQLFGKVSSFQDVIDKNPDFPSWSPADKNELADLYFNEKNPGLDEADYTEARTIFNKRYNVGSVAGNFEQLPLLNPTPGQPDKLSHFFNAANMAAGSVLAPANDLVNPFWRTAQQDYTKKYQQAYPGIEADPGFLGDAYRLHENRYVNMAGQLGAGFFGVGQLLKNSTGQALGRVPGLSRLGTDALRNMSAVGKFSGLTNAADVIHGKQNPLQALANTAMDIATAPIGGKSRLGNAAVEGASGYASGFTASVLDDITNGRQPNLTRADMAGKEQAAIGAGMGLALGSNQAKSKPTAQVRGLDRSQTIGVKAPGQPHNIRTEVGQISERVRQAVQAKLDQAARHQSVTEAKTQQARLTALKKQFEALSQLANNQNAHPNVRRNAKTMQARILETHNALKAQYDQQFGKPGTPKAEKQNIEVGGKDFSNVVALVKDMRAKGNVKQANLMLNAFTPETKAKLYDEVHRQEQVEKKAQAAAQRSQPTKPTGQTVKTGDMLMDALRAATERRTPEGATTELQAGMDEYARMAKEQGVTPAKVTQAESGGKTLQAKATISKPANGTPVGDVLVDALRAATEKPAGTATEYRAPGPDEYARMAKEAREKTAKAGTGSKVIKGEVNKTEEAPKKGKNSTPESKAAQEKAIREEITDTLDTLRQHNDWAEQPATDFLNRHDIDYKKLPNVGSVLHYGIFIPRKGMIAFKYNTPIGALLEKTGLPAMASKVKAKSGLDAIKSDLQDLAIDSDVYTGDKQDLFRQADQAAMDQMAARDAEENAYYARVEKAEARVKYALENAQTADDLSNIFERLEGDEFAGMPPEFFDSMVAEYSRHAERIDNAQRAGSAEPQRSPGQNSENPKRPEGQTGQESRFGEPTQKDLMPVETMRQIAKEASAAGESVRIRYWAERSGETGEFHNKVLHDVKILPGKNGGETRWNGINADGQSHTYIERNNAGSLKDSNIISVEKTGQPAEFKRVIHPETGSAAVEHIQSGEIIPQIAKKGVKSSTLHAKMNELITAVNDGKRVPVDRILDTAREFNAQKAVESQLETMSQEERAKLYEAEMGEPC